MHACTERGKKFRVGITGMWVLRACKRVCVSVCVCVVEVESGCFVAVQKKLFSSREYVIDFLMLEAFLLFFLF